MNSNCRYIVKARTVLFNNETGEYEFRTVENFFENEEPIYAREKAFKYRNEFIYGMLLALGIEDKEIGWNEDEKRIERINDRDLRKILNHCFEIEEDVLDEDEFFPDDTISWYPSYKTGIWILFEITEPNYKNEYAFEDHKTLVIDKFTRYSEPLPTPPLYMHLQEELNFYRKNNFKTKHYERDAIFFDDEEYIEGSGDEIKSIVKFEYLKTEFDWTEYDKINWWKTPIEKELDNIKLEINYKLLIQNGENEKVEFKPTLTNNPEISNRNFEKEIAETICAFANSKGGHLFIGVSDNQKIIGLDLDRDTFLKKISRIKNFYFDTIFANSVFGKFITLDNKIIFILTIFPNSEPVFLKNRDELGNVIKQFFIRSDAGNRNLYDIEKMYRYIVLNWKLSNKI